MNSRVILNMVIGALRDAYAAECEDLTEDEGALFRVQILADLHKYETLAEKFND